MINIVIGKPGSGKTYHIVRYIYDVLCDLIKKGDDERQIYTNVSLNVEEFNIQLSAEFRRDIDVSDYLVLLTPEELQYNSSLVEREDRIEKRVAGRSYFSVAPGSKAFFWNRFDDNALIIIDEIQKYLSSVREDSESEKQSLIEYFSLHRHKRHDWFFITQNLMSIPVEVRRVSEKVYNIFNAKSISLGFPINIPLRDIETLLAGFNFYRQVYRVREGYLEGTYRVVYEDSVDVVVMEKRVFRLYQTHTALKTDQGATLYKGDSALPYALGPGQRWRAIRWFLGKHWFHLTVKLTFLVWFFGGIYLFFARNKSKSPSIPPPPELASSVEVADDQDLEKADFEPIPEDAAPAVGPTTIIFNRIVSIDGVEYRVGDVYADKVIVDINARKGVVYEPLEDYYYHAFGFVNSCAQLSHKLRLSRGDE